MTSAWSGLACVASLAWGMGGSPRDGQDPALTAAVERARVAWLAHDVATLVEGADTIRLTLPGVAGGAPLRPGQAARLLGDFLQDAAESSVVVLEVRPVDAEHAYAELVRRYAVRGTTDLREERLFLGFRRRAGVWRLREARVTP